jgi:hypothetical protein
MSSFTISLISFACVFGGALLGMILRARLPDHHLSKESQDAIKVGTGLVSTMAALVLGLLVSSAKSSYDRQADEVTEMSADFLRLDRLLANFGPEATELRADLRTVLAGTIDRIWAADPATQTTSAPTSPRGEALYVDLLRLQAGNDAQRKLQSQAEGIVQEIGRTRLLLVAQAGNTASMPLVVVLVFWLSAIFVSFGLFAPRNTTVLVALCVGALAVSGALYLTLEMNRPFNGLIKISDAPARHTLAMLGK